MFTDELAIESGHVVGKKRRRSARHREDCRCRRREWAGTNEPEPAGPAQKSTTATMQPIGALLAAPRPAYAPPPTGPRGRPGRVPRPGHQTDAASTRSWPQRGGAEHPKGSVGIPEVARVEVDNRHVGDLALVQGKSKPGARAGSTSTARTLCTRLASGKVQLPRPAPILTTRSSAGTRLQQRDLLRPQAVRSSGRDAVAARLGLSAWPRTRNITVLPMYAIMAPQRSSRVLRPSVQRSTGV